VELPYEYAATMRVSLLKRKYYEEIYDNRFYDLEKNG
jgi:hypothetical protein